MAGLKIQANLCHPGGTCFLCRRTYVLALWKFPLLVHLVTAPLSTVKRAMNNQNRHLETCPPCPGVPWGLAGMWKDLGVTSWVAARRSADSYIYSVEISLNHCHSERSATACSPCFR